MSGKESGIEMKHNAVLSYHMRRKNKQATRCRYTIERSQNERKHDRAMLQKSRKVRDARNATKVRSRQKKKQDPHNKK
jgi:hypothetical protein